MPVSVPMPVSVSVSMPMPVPVPASVPVYVCLYLCLCMCVHTKGGKWRQGLLKSISRKSSRIPHSTRGQTG